MFSVPAETEVFPPYRVVKKNTKLKKVSGQEGAIRLELPQVEI